MAVLGTGGKGQILRMVWCKREGGEIDSNVALSTLVPASSLWTTDKPR